MADTSALETLFKVIRDEKRTHANTAERVGNALLAILPFLGEFIRKDQPDSTRYLLSLLGGAIVGESGQITLNPDGSITCHSIHVDGSAIFDELVFNHQNVLEGDTYFTDRAIIDTAEAIDINVWRLTLRKMFEADQFTFHVGDIVKWSENDLTSKGIFNTGYGRVEQVNGMTMIVTLYDGEDCPGGQNCNPFEAARMARHGHVSDESRQYHFYVSSQTGAFMFMQGVDKPILEDSANGSNLSAWIGLPPDSYLVRQLVQKGVINPNQPYVYSKGIITENLIKIDYKGNPQYTSRDCGTWDETRQYVHGFDETEQAYVTDHVWWKGCLFKATVAKPTVGREPRFNNTDWVCVFGAENVTVDVQSSKGDWFEAGSAFTTTLVANVKNAEMQLTEEEIGRANIRWERIFDEGTGDEAWNALHNEGRCGLSLLVNSATDIPAEWLPGTKVSFRCTIWMPDGKDYKGCYSIIM